MSKRGILITFEGPEGAGKSTHSQRLASWLKAKGYSVVLAREPGGTALGQKLRNLLLECKGKFRGISSEAQPLVELCLYEASRAALVAKVIRPALKAGAVVVLDRYQDSTWVYQGWAGGLNLKLIEQIGKAATGGLRPNLTFLLDLPAAQGLARVKRPNRMEAKSLLFHRKVRQGYLALARGQRRRFRVIQATSPAHVVQKAIRKALQDVLHQHRWA